MARRTPADEYSVEDAPPFESAAQLADDGGRQRLADAADPIPVLPRTARKADAAISALCGLAFAVVAIWISRRGHAVPAIDRHTHAWVLAHRGPWNVDFARNARWGGIRERRDAGLNLSPHSAITSSLQCRGRPPTRISQIVFASVTTRSLKRSPGRIGRCAQYQPLKAPRLRLVPEHSDAPADRGPRT